MSNNDNNLTNHQAQIDEINNEPSVSNKEQITDTGNVSDLSKVNPDNKITLYHLIGYIILGVIVLAIMLSGLLHSNKKIKMNDDVKTNADYNQQLAANLAAINQAKQVQVPPPSIQSITPSSPIVQPPVETITPEDQEEQQLLAEQAHEHQVQAEREWQARLSAPTGMMDSDTTSSTSNNAANNNQNNSTVFASGGANSDFGNQNTGVVTAEATKIAHPDYTIASGELIKANLETAINSDLPGMVRATVEYPVYAYTGDQPLIPAGSRLMGQYSSGIVQGQSRVMVVWNRVILPNGVSAQLNSPSTDNLGVSGQGADSIDRHFWEQFGEATLISVLGAGTATAGVSSSDEYNSASEYRSAVSQSLSQSASNTLNQNDNIKPTITINQGTEINVFVSRDVDFSNVLVTNDITGAS